MDVLSIFVIGKLGLRKHSFAWEQKLLVKAMQKVLQSAVNALLPSVLGLVPFPFLSEHIGDKTEC